jgi:hypothetical protein
MFHSAQRPKCKITTPVPADLNLRENVLEAGCRERILPLTTAERASPSPSFASQTLLRGPARQRKDVSRKEYVSLSQRQSRSGTLWNLRATLFAWEKRRERHLPRALSFFLATLASLSCISVLLRGHGQGQAPLSHSLWLKSSLTENTHRGMKIEDPSRIQKSPCSTERGTEGETLLRCCLLGLLFVFQVNWFKSLKLVVVDGYLISRINVDFGFLFRIREPTVWVVSKTLKNQQFMQ